MRLLRGVVAVEAVVVYDRCVIPVSGKPTLGPHRGTFHPLIGKPAHALAFVAKRVKLFDCISQVT